MSSRHGANIKYRLSSHYEDSVNALLECLTRLEYATTRVIAKECGIQGNDASKMLLRLFEAGEIGRDYNAKKKQWIYSSHKPLPFGMGNPLTMMFNNALNECRAAH